MFKLIVCERYRSIDRNSRGDRGRLALAPRTIISLWIGAGVGAEKSDRKVYTLRKFHPVVSTGSPDATDQIGFSAFKCSHFENCYISHFVLCDTSELICGNTSV
jgi:hypothetical protein